MPWIMAAIYDRFMQKTEEHGVRDWRAELLGDLRGSVLEVGAGTGINLAHYPPQVERLVLSEPDRHMRRRLEERLASDPPSIDVELDGSSIEALPFPDGSFDAVVSTLVLCSVPDLAASLAEVHRVLKPGGRFVFLEHVAADERPGRLLWQKRIEPFWRWFAGNCHLTRRTGQAIEAAGFVVERSVRASMRKALPFVRPTVRGVARRPETT